MGGEFGGEGIHVHAWLSPFTVHLKLSQHGNQLYPKQKLFTLKKAVGADSRLLSYYLLPPGNTFYTSSLTFRSSAL